MPAPSRRKSTGNPPGRPSLYDSLALPILDQIGDWARKACTYQQIADNLGINVGTLIEWRNKYPALAEQLKMNREMAKSDIEHALYRKATGYWGKKKAVTQRGDVVEFDEWYPPDTTAAIFLLKNLDPVNYRDKREVSHDVGDNLEGIIRDIMTDNKKPPKPIGGNCEPYDIEAIESEIDGEDD